MLVGVVHEVIAWAQDGVRTFLARYAARNPSGLTNRECPKYIRYWAAFMDPVRTR